MTQEPFPVRALFLSTRISGLAPPNDTAHLKVHYPADPSGDEMERNTGQVRAATAGAPFPVIIFFPGINVGPEGLSWLAVSLASRGMIVLTYTLIGEEFPGQVSLTPGIGIAALAPDKIGRASCRERV